MPMREVLRILWQGCAKCGPGMALIVLIPHIAVLMLATGAACSQTISCAIAGWWVGRFFGFAKSCARSPFVLAHNL
jgi:hypothetical protein